MPATITYDKDGNKIPSREFLSMVVILLRKCEVEAGMSFLQFLESFEDKDVLVDGYDDNSLRKAVYKMLKENYLDQEQSTS